MQLEFHQLTFGASAVSEAFLCIKQTIVLGHVVDLYGDDFQEDHIFRANAILRANAMLMLYKRAQIVWRLKLQKT